MAQLLQSSGLDVSFVARLVAESFDRGFVRRRLKSLLGRSRLGRKALANRQAGLATAYSVEPVGILLGPMVSRCLGLRARQHLDRIGDGWAGWATARIATRVIKPDLIVCAEGGAPSLLRHLHGRIPVIIDVAHPHPLEVERCRVLASRQYPEWKNSWDDPPYNPRVAERLNAALGRAQGIWVGSRYTRDSLIRSGPVRPERVALVPYGRDTRYPPKEKRYEGNYLFVGAVSLRKGVPLMLEAWKRSTLPGDGCTLHIVGTAFFSEVERSFAETPGVLRRGWMPQPDLERLRAECDALLWPSYCEGFGLVLIEAAAIGLPWIGTDTGAAREILGLEYREWCCSIGDSTRFAELLSRFHGSQQVRDAYRALVAERAPEFSEAQYTKRLRTAIEALK